MPRRIAMSLHHASSFSRRDFLFLAAGAGALTLAGGLGGQVWAAAPPFSLPPLPYAENALEPVISGRTVGFHYGKHTRAYFDNANKLVADTPLAGQPLDKVFLTAAKDPKQVGLFRNAAQAWNHVFYWNGLMPKGGGAPTGKLAKAIDAAFGGPDGCRKALPAAAVGQFGSGWAWLVADGAGKLKVMATGNADNPMQEGLKPLWVIDVWEHAYYLDYQNKRADYVQAVLEKLVNWEFVARNLG
jgi:superoxide dismutase, Fe-Mn family